MQSRARRGLIRQGDVLLIPVAGLPGKVRVLRRDSVVLAQGEVTGHAHRVSHPGVELYTQAWGPRYLVVHGHAPATLQHEEHDPLEVPPGVWEIRRQREFTPARTTGRWVTD